MMAKASNGRVYDSEQSVEKARKLLANIQKGANDLAASLKAGKTFFDSDFELRRSALQKGYMLSLQISPQFIGEHIDSLVWHHAFYTIIQSLARSMDEMRAAKRHKDTFWRNRLHLLEMRIKMLLTGSIGFYEHALFTVLQQLKNAIDLNTKRLLICTLNNSHEVLTNSGSLADEPSADNDSLLYSTAQDNLVDERLANLARICVHLGDLHRYASARGGQRHAHEANARKLYRIAAAVWPREAGSALAQLAVCSSQRVATSDVPIVMFLLLAMVTEKPPRNALENVKKRLQSNRGRLAKERFTQRHASLSTFICTLFETVRKLVLFEPRFDELNSLCESTLNMFDELDRVETALSRRHKTGRKLYGDVLFRLCVVVIAATTFTRRYAKESVPSSVDVTSTRLDRQRYVQITSALFLSFFLRLLQLAERYLTTGGPATISEAAPEQQQERVESEQEPATVQSGTQRKAARRGKSRLRRRAMFEDEDPQDVNGAAAIDSDVFDDSDELEDEEDDSSESTSESESDSESDGSDAETDDNDSPNVAAATSEAVARLSVKDCVEKAAHNRDCSYVLAALKLCCDQLRAHFDPTCFADAPNSFAARFRSLVTQLPSQSDLITYLNDCQDVLTNVANENSDADLEFRQFELDLDVPTNNLLAEDMYTLSALTVNGGSVTDRLAFVQSVVHYFNYATKSDLQCALRVLDIVDCFTWFTSVRERKRATGVAEADGDDFRQNTRDSNSENASDNDTNPPSDPEGQQATSESAGDAEDADLQTAASNFDDIKMEKMRRLAELRLQAQVDELQQQVRAQQAQQSALRRNAELTATHTVCAVLDTTVLCEQLPQLRRIIHLARKRSADTRAAKKHFLFVVPQAVISQLDHLKNDDARSRDASRFLETEIHSDGTPLHLQQPTESLPSPTPTGGTDTASTVLQRRREPDEARAEQIVGCARYFTKLVDDFRKRNEAPTAGTDEEAQTELLTTEQSQSQMQFARHLVVVLTCAASHQDLYTTHLNSNATADGIPLQSLAEFDRQNFQFAHSPSSATFTRLKS